MPKLADKPAEGQFSKYEVARILGARALQLAMDAPILVKTDVKELERMRYDPLKIAEIELQSGALPISVKRPFPAKRDAKLRKVKVEEKKPEKDDKEIVEKEVKEEKEIKEEGEIMELAQPEDEVEVEETEEEGVE